MCIVPVPVHIIPGRILCNEYTLKTVFKSRITVSGIAYYIFLGGVLKVRDLFDKLGRFDHVIEFMKTENLLRQ